MITLLKEKLEILNHQTSFINFVQSLAYLDEYVLRQPIREGKWSIIEIIGHFYFWDEFVLQKRLPYLLSGNTFPPGPNANVLNKQAALLARQENIRSTLEKCLHIRTELIEALSAITDENWLIEIKINQTRLTIYEYFKGLMEHDIHHINQIKSAIVSI